MTRLADCTHKCRGEAEERFEHTQVKFPSASTWRSLQLPSAQRSRSKLDLKTRSPLSVNNYHSNHLILCIKIVHNLHKRKQTCHTQKNKKKKKYHVRCRIRLNPLIPTHDLHVASPCNIHTLSGKQITRMPKLIRKKVDLTPNSRGGESTVASQELEG